MLFARCPNPYACQANPIINHFFEIKESILEFDAVAQYQMLRLSRAKLLDYFFTPKTPSYAALADTTVVDRKRRAVVAKWGLGGRFGNYPMALDDTNKRLFVGCRIPAKLVVLDKVRDESSPVWRPLGTADDIFYDAGRRVVYVSAAKGQWTFPAT